MESRGRAPLHFLPNLKSFPLASAPDSSASSANAPRPSRSPADCAVDVSAVDTRSVDERAQAQGRSETVERAAPPADGAAREFDAAIFDMDGVITKTADVHSRAWKRMFDEFLQRRAAREGGAFHEFTHARDYLAYVDGRPRDRGVAAFLKSREIELPPGSPDDPPGTETLAGLGNRKNALFQDLIEREGVSPFASTLDLIREMRRRGIRIGLATSSRNAAPILEKTGAAPLFATVVDGLVSEKLGLKGKPAPDIFTAAAANLGVPGARAIVVEDAASGVQAGARGGFALVIGIARENNARELREQGADLVVTDLGETSVDDIDRLIRAKRAAAGDFQLPRDGNGSAHK